MTCCAGIEKAWREVKDLAGPIEFGHDTDAGREVGAVPPLPPEILLAYAKGA